HGFGDFGPRIDNRSPHLHWLRLARQDRSIPSYENWSMATVMARNGRFQPPGDSDPYSYGYHFDAGLYAAYLREYAQARGVTRIEATIGDVELRPDDGYIAAVKLQDGRRIDGDLFIDCSGFRGLLIEGVLRAGYEDWSNYLPCNSALAVPCARVDKLTPYTMSTAKAAGWLWRIPLQHRTGNGHVYSSHFTSDDEAARVLLAGLDGEALDEPRQLRFVTGRRRFSWLKNCVAIGLSAGFVEPLESTSISLIENAVGKLIEYFPDRDFAPGLAREFNRYMGQRYESVRDFIILHYKLTSRDDSEFWRHCAAMPIPDSLQHQIALFRESGRVAIHDRDGFLEPSFVSMLLGLNVVPRSDEPFVSLLDRDALQRHMAALRAHVIATVTDMPDHDDYIARTIATPSATSR
ncbi:MAG: tryptophan halogenase family protein, partial [Duganella sp.]